MKLAPILAFGLAACAGNVLVERPDPPPAADLDGRFEQIAFYSEFEDGERPLMRVETDLRMAVVGRDADRVERYLPAIVRAFKDVAGLAGRSVVADVHDPNVIVLMHSRDVNADVVKGYAQSATGEFDQDWVGTVAVARHAVCGGTLFGSDAIEGALIFLPAEVSDRLMGICIIQEIAQTFGLPNDIDDPDGTVFSSRSRRTTLSKTDRRLIQILYDDRLRSGMTRAEAMPIVRRIIAEKGW